LSGSTAAYQVHTNANISASAPDNLPKRCAG